jgi:hypothetical protein
MPTDVTVKVDDRVRLLSALLAVTTFPEQAQQRRPHGTHLHARATSKQLAAWREHPAALALQALLDKGAPLEALFTLILTARFPDLIFERAPAWMPDNWGDKLRDFYAAANLAQWWKDEDAAWVKARADAAGVLENATFKPILRLFVGDVQENFVFMPNISYPTDHELGLRIGRDLICIAPPRLAWGDSAPWSYNEDPAYIYRVALGQYGRLAYNAYLRAHPDIAQKAAQKPFKLNPEFVAQHPKWDDQFGTLFIAAMVALLLEEHISKAEADAHVLMERKTNHMIALPAMITVLKRQIDARKTDDASSLLDSLPVLASQLHVTMKIMAR